MMAIGPAETHGIADIQPSHGLSDFADGFIARLDILFPGRGRSDAERITRPVLVMDALEKLSDGNLAMETPADPRTGAISIELDPLEWIHRITCHIPDPGRHGQRFYGAYSNRGRICVASEEGKSTDLPAARLSDRDDSDCSREARSTWARLIQKIFEADPLLCSCGGRMRIVSFITDPRVVDGILRHCESGRCKAQDPFEPRAPPAAASETVHCNNSEAAADIRLSNRAPVGLRCV